MQQLTWILLTVIFCGCGAPNNNSDAVNASDESGGSVHANADPVTPFGGTPFRLNGCYQMTMKQDTAFMSLEVQDSVVSGNLQYNWHSRDGNTGTFRGVLRDSLIIADYTFESEGLTSVREIMFKISDTTLLQGFGDLQDRQGRIVFRNPDQLQFLQDHPFVKVPCH